MLTKVKKWGNSQGVRFPKVILDEAHIKVGDEVNVSVQAGKIVIETVNQVRGTYSLKELVSKIPRDHQTEEMDWGSPVGKEKW